MGQRLVIELIKDGERLGNIYHHWDGYFLNAISRVSDLINNYNRNLVNEDLDPNIFAIRFFEEDIAVGSSVTKMLKPQFCKDSYEFAKHVTEAADVFLETNENARDSSCGRIALTEDDIEGNISNGEQFASINLDTRSVSFAYTVVKYDFDEYRELYESEIEDLKTCPFESFDSIHFNELEDLYKFIEENLDGFVDPFLDVVYAPIA